MQINIASLPLTQRAVRSCEVVARLRPGISLKQADAEAKSIARQLEQEFPQFRRGWTVKLLWLRQALLGDYAGRVNKALVALTGGVAFLLLICCANVANLQLARGIARTRELALRRALGASRSRLVRQLLTESMLLALLGGAGGLLLAHWILPLLAVINPVQGVSLAGFFLEFRPDHLLTLKMVLPESKYSEHRQRVAFVNQILERLKNLPGVVSAGTTTNIPLEREIAYDARFSVEGRSPRNPNDVPITSHRLVSPDYLKTLGVTLLKGRLIEETDRAGQPPVVVISEQLAREAWPGEDPLGKRIKRVRPGQDFPWMTVIGVIRDVKEDLFNYRVNRPVWYVPYAQLENNFPVNLVVRTSDDPASVTTAIREATRAVDPDQPISDVMTMNQNLARVLVTERFSAILMSVLAAAGLLLAALGLYGVMAYSVSQRTTEIGVRVALGAQPIHVLRLILGQGAKLTLLGIAIGLTAASGLTRLLVGLLFEVDATDPATFISISLLLVSIALLACFLPARRALAVDPMVALRYE